MGHSGQKQLCYVINKYKTYYMTLHDTWTIVKKIVVGILVFLVPLIIIAAILWLIQNWSN